MFLSIDFEDFNHDLKRGLGICKSGKIKSDLLWEKYNEINEFYKKSDNEVGKYGTFFCTAIIAEKEPSLIRKIAKDGHEIACHSYYHDLLINQQLSDIERYLSKAKDLLQEVSGKEVLGFRAPSFAINKINPSQYNIIQKIFKYDSSYFCSNKQQLDSFRKQMKLKELKLFPIYSKRILGKPFRLGGSYLKIFPKKYAEWMINEAKKNGFNPHIYLHPYEFGISKGFAIKRQEMNKIGFSRSLYWSLKQNQWLSFKNRNLKTKIHSLICKNKLDGILSNLL